MNDLISSEAKTYQDFHDKYSQVVQDFLRDWHDLSAANQERFLAELKPMFLGFLPQLLKFLMTNR